MLGLRVVRMPGGVKIPISEAFHSLQGEGRFAGCPSFFIRVAGCNLNCKWCDTKYALNLAGARYYSAEELSDLINMELEEGENIVVTGGEPGLYWGAMEDVLREASYYTVVEVETNGTQMINYDDFGDLYLNVSFKLSNSGVPLERRIKPEVLVHLDQYENTMFKVVVEKREDLGELMDLVNRLGLDWRKVAVMPQYSEAGGISEYGWLWDWCVRAKVRFISRLHVDVFGARRGI